MALLTNAILDARAYLNGREGTEGELRPILVFNIGDAKCEFAVKVVVDSASSGDDEIAAMRVIEGEVELPIADKHFGIRPPSARTVEIVTRAHEVSFVVDIVLLVKPQPRRFALHGVAVA
jgi:hypothetical protein